MQYAAIGSICLGVGIVMYILKKYGRGLNIMFLIAGGALAPVLGSWVGSALTSIGGALFGISASIAFAAAALAWFVIEFKNKGKHPKTCWVSLMLPVLLVSSGLPFFLKISNMVDQVGNQANTAVTQTK